MMSHYQLFDEMLPANHPQKSTTIHRASQMLAMGTRRHGIFLALISKVQAAATTDDHQCNAMQCLALCLPTVQAKKQPHSTRKHKTVPNHATYSPSSICTEHICAATRASRPSHSVRVVFGKLTIRKNERSFLVSTRRSASRRFRV